MDAIWSSMFFISVLTWDVDEIIFCNWDSSSSNEERTFPVDDLAWDFCLVILNLVSDCSCFFISWSNCFSFIVESFNDLVNSEYDNLNCGIFCISDDFCKLTSSASNEYFLVLNSFDNFSCSSLLLFNSCIFFSNDSISDSFLEISESRSFCSNTPVVFFLLNPPIITPEVSIISPSKVVILILPIPTFLAVDISSTIRVDPKI